MRPREMFIEGLLRFAHSGNVHKRANRLDRLAFSIGAEVSYGLSDPSVGVELNERYYEAKSLREAEKILRYLKRNLLRQGEKESE
jgi:hypothetical protein